MPLDAVSSRSEVKISVVEANNFQYRKPYRLQSSKDYGYLMRFKS